MQKTDQLEKSAKRQPTRIGERQLAGYKVSEIILVNSVIRRQVDRQGRADKQARMQR